MSLYKLIDFEVSNILVELKTKFNLEKFKLIDGIKNKIVYANTHLNKDTKYLGHGSSRIALLLSNRFILKIVRPNAIEKGLAQNKAEIELYKKTKSDLITKIYDFDPSHEWLISELAKPITVQEFEQFADIKWYEFSFIIRDMAIKIKDNDIKNINNLIDLYEELIRAAGIHKADLRKLHTYKHVINIFKKNELLKKVVLLLFDINLSTEDIVYIHHWGKTADNRIVFFDYGATEEVIKKYY